MKKLITVSILILLFFTTTSLIIHKFYIAIFQVEENIAKKRLEITTRIFADDLALALEKKLDKKVNLLTNKISNQDSEIITNYIKTEFFITVNGQKRELVFKSNELDNNILISYFVILNSPKIKSLEIENSILTETFDQQQNIIQTHFNNKRESLLLTNQKTKGMLK